MLNPLNNWWFIVSSAFSVGFKTEKKELQLILSWLVKCDSCENVSLGFVTPVCRLPLYFHFLWMLKSEYSVWRKVIFSEFLMDRILFETLQNTNSLKIFSHHVQMYVELQSQYFIGSFIFLIFSVKDKNVKYSQRFKNYAANVTSNSIL